MLYKKTNISLLKQFGERMIFPEMYVLIFILGIVFLLMGLNYFLKIIFNVNLLP